MCAWPERALPRDISGVRRLASMRYGLPWIVAEADGRPGILGNHAEPRGPRRGSPPSWWDRRRSEGRTCGPVSETLESCAGLPCWQLRNRKAKTGSGGLAPVEAGVETAGGLMAAWNVGGRDRPRIVVKVDVRGHEVSGQAPNRVVLNKETRKKWRHPVSTRRSSARKPSRSR